MNKYERKLLNQKMDTRYNMFVGDTYVGKKEKQINKRGLSYRTKAEERDRLKLEREGEVWEKEAHTTL